MLAFWYKLMVEMQNDVSKLSCTMLKDGRYLYKAGFNYERACKYVKLLAITYPVG